MKRRRVRWMYVVAIAAILVGGASMFAAADDLPPGGIRIPRIPAPSPLVLPSEPPTFLATGGPYVGGQEAMAAAAQIAKSPISRQDVRFMHYRDVIEFTGNRTLTIDPAREVYFVVTSATFIGRHGEPICPSYTAVIDATTGVGFSVSCGDATWPTRLPPAFNP
jgi:hypothetical protein